MGNPSKKMKIAGLMIASAGIFAYVGVEGVPKSQSAGLKDTIDRKLTSILEILEEEGKETSRGTIPKLQPDGTPIDETMTTIVLQDHDPPKGSRLTAAYVPWPEGCKWSDPERTVICAKAGTCCKPAWKPHGG